MLSDYYDKMLRTGTACVPTHKSPSPMTSASQARQVGNYVPSSSSSAWSSNPLIWTTIISLSIAVLATIVIVPLVICVHVKQRCAGKPDATGERQQPTSLSPSYSAVENGTAVSASKVPPTTPNGLKEKSGKLVLI